MTVVIDRIAAGGDGVGRLNDGMTVFVPRTAPGDRVEIDITKKRKRYAHARIHAVVEAAPARVEPPCSHYTVDECGGCQLQHMQYAAQLDAKQRIVGDALRRIGNFDVKDPSIVPAPDPWRYRTKITLAARGPVVGFHTVGKPDAVFALDRCKIAVEPLMTLWADVRRQRDLLPRNLQRIVLRLDRQHGLHIILGDGSREVWDPEPLAAALDAHPVSIWWRPKDGAPRMVAGQASAYPALAFEQAHPRLAETLRQRLVAAAGDDLDGRVVWDLYAGVGDTAVALAERGATVWAVDHDRSAIAWGRTSLPHPNVTRIADRVEDATHRLPVPTTVVVNPPRTGLEPKVAALLEDWGRRGVGRALLYVSCDPATLARDLRRMSTCFDIRSVEAFDMFPQTSHVETLVSLKSR